MDTELILELVERSGNVTVAANLAGVHRDTVYKRAGRDQNFKKDLEDAQMRFRMRRRAAQRRRARSVFGIFE